MSAQKSQYSLRTRSCQSQFLPTFPALVFLLHPVAICEADGVLAASYHFHVHHSESAGRIQYLTSSSRTRTTLRRGPSVLQPVKPQSAQVRSKDQPTPNVPGVVDEPVNSPFGLQTIRSFMNFQ